MRPKNQGIASSEMSGARCVYREALGLLRLSYVCIKILGTWLRTDEFVMKIDRPVAGKKQNEEGSGIISSCICVYSKTHTNMGKITN